jgi:hypothetical protein
MIPYAEQNKEKEDKSFLAETVRVRRLEGPC